jgi:cyclophilin family peptidyl-prolyl cis-trans isomerase
MFWFERPVLVFLLVAIFAQCESIIAFQQKTTVPIKKTKTLAACIGSRSMTLLASKRESIHGNGDQDNLESCVLSRRKAVCGGLSVATIASWWPSKEVIASESTSSTTAKPFRVLFTIQIDFQKPNDLSELEVEVRPDWAPLAAERFRNLVELGFYRDAPFFRVLPGYVAQFGISSNPKLNKQWVYCDTTDEESKIKCKPSLPDEPRKQPNKRGTLSFASSGKNSRKTQIFINLSNNDGPPNFLDAQNFIPFAFIVRGMEPDNNIPKRLNSEYGGRVNQGKAAYYGGEYFEAVFPNLSVIRDAKIL